MRISIITLPKEVRHQDLFFSPDLSAGACPCTLHLALYRMFAVAGRVGYIRQCACQSIYLGNNEVPSSVSCIVVY